MQRNRHIQGYKSIIVNISIFQLILISKILFLSNYFVVGTMIASFNNNNNVITTPKNINKQEKLIKKNALIDDKITSTTIFNNQVINNKEADKTEYNNKFNDMWPNSYNEKFNKKSNYIRGSRRLVSDIDLHSRFLTDNAARDREEAKLEDSLRREFVRSSMRGTDEDVEYMFEKKIYS